MSEPHQSEDEKARDMDLQAVLELPAGRRFLYDFLYRRCGLDAFRPDGQRTVAATLNTELFKKFPNQWMRLRAEGDAARVERRITAQEKTTG